MAETRKRVWRLGLESNMILKTSRSKQSTKEDFNAGCRIVGRLHTVDVGNLAPLNLYSPQRVSSHFTQCVVCPSYIVGSKTYILAVLSGTA